MKTFCPPPPRKAVLPCAAALTAFVRALAQSALIGSPLVILSIFVQVRRPASGVGLGVFFRNFVFPIAYFVDGIPGKEVIKLIPLHVRCASKLAALDNLTHAFHLGRFHTRAVVGFRDDRIVL